MSETKIPKWLPVANLIGYIVTVVVNSLANILPLNGKNTGALSDAIPNYFVPAGYVFSIWGVIYVVLGIFAVYQILPKNRDAAFQQAIGPWFLLASIANSVWIFLWHWVLVPLSLVIMLVLLVSLLAIYWRLQIGVGPNPPRAEWIATRLPFSIYLGWITVATIANVTAVLVNDLGVPGLDEVAVAWTAVVLVVAAVIGVLVLKTRKDLAYGLVLVWAVTGILIKQVAVVAVAVTAGIVVGVIATATVWAVIQSRK